MSRRIEAQTVKAMVQELQAAVTEDPTLKTQCRESSLHSQRCLNPLCNGLVESKRKHAPVKHYCSDQCGQQASILRRAAALLVPVGKEKAWEIFERLERQNGGN